MKITKIINTIGNKVQVEIDRTTFLDIAQYRPELAYEQLPTNGTYDAKKFEIDGHEVITHYDKSSKTPTIIIVNKETVDELYEEGEVFDIAAFRTEVEA